MSYQYVAPNTTYCPDTPENWVALWRLIRKPKTKIKSNASRQDFNKALQHQISKENKQLRSLRSHLPGYEPDR